MQNLFAVVTPRTCHLHPMKFLLWALLVIAIRERAFLPIVLSLNHIIGHEDTSNYSNQIIFNSVFSIVFRNTAHFKLMGIYQDGKRTANVSRTFFDMGLHKDFKSSHVSPRKKAINASPCVGRLIANHDVGVVVCC